MGQVPSDRGGIETCPSCAGTGAHHRWIPLTEFADLLLAETVKQPEQFEQTMLLTQAYTHLTEARKMVNCQESLLEQHLDAALHLVGESIGEAACNG